MSVVDELSGFLVVAAENCKIVDCRCFSVTVAGMYLSHLCGVYYLLECTMIVLLAFASGSALSMSTAADVSARVRMHFCLTLNAVVVAGVWMSLFVGCDSLEEAQL